MPVPTHSSACKTRAFPVKCYSCGSEVYYFFCSCGSKVFFDSLGSPWPIHVCEQKQAVDIIDEIYETYGALDQSALNRIKILCEERGLILSEDTSECIQKHINKYHNKIRNIVVQPYDKNELIVGKIIAINKNINFYKKLNLENNFITKQLLGTLTKEPFSELVIKTHPNYENTVEEFHALIPTMLLDTMRLKMKVEVVTKLKTHTTIAGPSFWLVEFINLNK